MELKNIYRRLRSSFLSKDLNDLYLSASLFETNPPNDCRNVFQTWRTSRFDFEHAAVIRKCIQSNPGWRFFLFLDSDMNHFMETNYQHDPILRVFQGARYMATKADIWRLCVLHKYGGLYLDIDSTVKFDLEKSLNQRTEFLSYAGDRIANELQEKEYPEDVFFLERPSRVESFLLHPEHMILNWCMYFKPQHPILQLALDDIRDNSKYYWDKQYENTRRAVIHLAGPLSLTRAVWRYVKQGNNVCQETFDFADLATFKAIGRHSVYFAQDHYTIGTDKTILQSSLLTGKDNSRYE